MSHIIAIRTTNNDTEILYYLDLLKILPQVWASCTKASMSTYPTPTRGLGLLGVTQSLQNDITPCTAQAVIWFLAKVLRHMSLGMALTSHKKMATVNKRDQGAHYRRNAIY